jgi:hypothetical protein
MKTILHTKEQGLRVHKLAKLGGLVALAGLENIDPALLLGAFLELAAQLSRLGLQHVTRLRHNGLQKLSERKKEKHAYQQQATHTLLLKEATLKLDEIKKLIIRLGGKVPVLEKDIVPELYRLMR